MAKVDKFSKNKGKISKKGEEVEVKAGSLDKCFFQSAKQSAKSAKVLPPREVDAKAFVPATRPPANKPKK